MSSEEDGSAVESALVEIGTPDALLTRDLEQATQRAADQVFARGDTQTLNDLSAEVGLDVEEIDGMLGWLGIEVENHDEVMFGERDSALVRFLNAATSGLLTDDEGVE